MTQVVVEESRNTIVVQEGDTTVVTAFTAGPQGPAGAAGPAGPAGPQGIQGPPGTDAAGALTSIGGIPDVDTTQVVDGSVLVYHASTSTYVAGPLDTRLTLTDGGNF